MWVSGSLWLAHDLSRMSSTRRKLRRSGAGVGFGGKGQAVGVDGETVEVGGLLQPDVHLVEVGEVVEAPG